MKKNGKKLIKKAFALMLALVMAVPTVDYSALFTVQAEETENTGITLRTRDDEKSAAAGYEEGAYVEWLPVAGANGYEVYVSNDQSNWTRVDDELIRSYDEYWRVDALGLTKGTWYVKVEAAAYNADKNKIATVAEKTFTVDVTAHDRSGYAWYDGGTASGAYNEDGTLRSDTNVVYITNANKDDVGLQNILYGYKNVTANEPLDVRLIGSIEDFKVMESGDIVIETNGNIGSKGITIEGVGEDAVANGWGIRLKNAVNVEIRNLGFMNCDSSEGDNIGLQQDNAHIWVHNCDFFYGHAGNDGDQKKGDGMLDCKKSDLITFSYNHFWDSGKSCLLGLEEGLNDPNFEGRITYHHNWFDHSDSRHPRIRYFTTHIYNNYYDGNSKYGIGAAEGGASVFAESNYFRNCKYPMLISQQGSDIKSGSGGTFEAVSSTDTNKVYENGSIIKAYGNIIIGATSFIEYEAAAAQANSDQNENNGFVAYVAVDDVNEETEQDNALNDEETMDADVESDDDDTKADTDDESDDNINNDTDGISGDDNADVNIDEESGDDNADVNIDEESGDDNADIDADEETGDDNADVDTDEESSLEAEVSYAQERAFTNDASVDFDAYVVKNRTDRVPESVKTKKGENTYNNFDIEANFYKYTPDDANDVPGIVMADSGRINGGDFKFEFDNSKDDTSSAVNDELKALCMNYKSSLKLVGGINGKTTTVYYEVTFDPGNGDEPVIVPVERNTAVEEPAAPANMPDGKEEFDGWYNGYRKWNFETVITENITLVGRWLADGDEPGSTETKPIGTQIVIHDFTTNGKDDPYIGSMDSPYFDIVGDLNTAAGPSQPYKYNGVDYIYNSAKDKPRLALKTSTISFTTTTNAKLVLVFFNTSKKLYVDGVQKTTSNGILELDINAAKHTITGKDTDYLYAIWVIPILTVNFDTQGGTTVNSQTLDSGTKLTKPTDDPTKADHIFDGWYTDNTYAMEYDFDTPVTSNITVYAKFIPEGFYAVIFDTQGGSKIEAQFVTDGDMPVKPGDPTRKGYVFEGWYKNSECTDGSEYNFSDPVTEEIRIYAKWKKQYTVTFNTGGGSAVDSQTVIEGQTCSKPGDPTKDGYVFGGWYKNRECTEGSEYNFTASVTENIRLYAKWKKQYTVIFNTGEGSVVGSQTVIEDELCSKPDDPTKGDHSFGGWYTDNTYVTEYNFDTPVTSDITLYAKFIPEGSHSVVFDTQSGSRIEAQFIEDGAKADQPADPTRSGYIFDGWYKDSECTDGNEYDFETSVIADITLFAKWVKGYTVTFNTNGGSEVVAQSIKSGEQCTKPADPAKDGCKFGGWYTDSECTDGNEYDFTGPVTYNIILYAKWTVANGLQIDFANKEEEYTYTGSAIKPEIIVTNNGNALVEGIDYTVKYSNNVKASAAAQIIVTGKGVYAGKTTPKKFTIAKKNIEDANIKAGRIVVVKSKKVPTPVLYYGGTKLTAKDFELENKNKTFSTESENETIKIKGINNFTGERDISVVVVKDSAALKKAAQKFTVKVNSDALKKLTYTGSSLEDDIKKCITEVSDKTNNKQLDPAKYEIAFPKNVIDAGKVKFTIVGMEEYSGCNVVKTCTIKPRAINGTKKAGETPSDNDVVITGITNSLDYISTGATFKDLSITWTNKARNDEGLEPLPLVEGRDYKLSYSANKKVGTNSAKCTITFKGNYKGKPVVNFSVDKTELNAATVDIINRDTANEKMDLIADKVCNGKKGVYKSTPYMSINNVLVKVSECEVKYYTDAGMNNEMTKDKPLEFGTNPYATVYVKITAKTSSKNFKTTQGTTPITGSYKVWVKEKKSNKVDLSKAKVVFYNGSTKTTKLPYTGGAVVPDKIEVLVGGKKVDETYYSYDIIANVNKGKATVVVYAKDNTNCIGGKAVTYNIAAHSFNNFNW